MILNYIKIAFRNFWRNKLNSFINLIGLSLGLAACILIMMFVSHEKSYDKFHKDVDRIFTIYGNFQLGDEKIRMSRLSPSVASQLKENDPNVEDAIRFYEGGMPLTVKANIPGSEEFLENNLLATDSNLFSFFSFELTQGNPTKALEAPFSVVLTKDMAEKYFGSRNPLGEQIKIKQDSTYDFTITGVIKDIPTNSSIQGEMLISMSSLSLMREFKRVATSELFQGGSFATYVKLYNSKNVAGVEETAVRLDRLSSPESTTTYTIDPFTNSHAEITNTGRFDYLNVFPLVALLILILALTNYISLTTARAGTRAKEVGVRKMSGANKRSLILQFYIESALFVGISFSLGIFISFICKDLFLSLLNIEIGNSFFLHPTFILALASLLVFAIVVSGIYPAMVLSSFKPIENFKNKLRKNSGTVAVRKTFTTLQFTIAVFLIICGIVMSVQLDFLRSKDTGLQRSNIVMVPVHKDMTTNATAFRNEIKKLAEVTQTTVAQYAMYAGHNIYYVSLPNSEESYAIASFNVDEHFIETMAVKWHLKPQDKSAFSVNKKIIINQKTIEEFGLEPDPRGAHINFGKQSFEIAGVVKDFNYTSLETPIRPLAFFITEEASANQNIIGIGSACLYVQYNSGANIPKLIGDIESLHKTFDEKSSFTYQFMDDAFDALYKAEERLSFIFYIFIVLALIIAGLGLLGLITFASEQRVKEIGIRKVLGASVSEIILLLSKDFMKLVLLSIIIASPIAWYFADSWLNYFAFRAKIPWWSFAMSGAIAIVLSIITLSAQGVKAAIANPVKSLRSE